MTLPGKPKITRFIAHVLGSRGSLLLSDLETPIDSSSGFPHDFFTSYIRAALDHAKGRRARYRTDGGGVVANAIARLRSDPTTFVDSSRTIAHHLEQVMKRSSYAGVIKPGDVMVAQFEMVRDSGEGTDAKEPPIFVAILKIKPSDAILREVKSIGNKRQIVFRTDDRVPPPNEEHEIQKIAVLSDRRLTTPEDHDLIILDHNLKKTEVARFFHHDFLESELTRDAQEDAERFVKRFRDGLAKRREEIHPPLTAPEVLVIADRAETFLSDHDRVSAMEVVQEAVSDLPGREPEAVKAFREELAENIGRHQRPDDVLEISEVVRIDRERARQVAERRTYRLDKGVKITGDSRAVAELVELHDELDPQGRTVLTIRSHTFQIQ